MGTDAANYLSVKSFFFFFFKVASKRISPIVQTKLLISSDKGMGCKAKLVISKWISLYSLNSSFLCFIPILLDRIYSKMRKSLRTCLFQLVLSIGTEI